MLPAAISIEIYLQKHEQLHQLFSPLFVDKELPVGKPKDGAMSKNNLESCTSKAWAPLQAMSWLRPFELQLNSLQFIFLEARLHAKEADVYVAKIQHWYAYGIFWSVFGVGVRYVHAGT